jgi:peptide-methionine (S)-S-oxide reductase
LHDELIAQEADMSKGSLRSLAMVLTVLGGALACQAGSGAAVPPPLIDEAKTPNPARETIVLAGGCFWGVQAVFQHVKGVISATSGYSGGTLKNPDYETVSSGSTGHAESVQVVYDPSQITYGQLLRIFFSVAHDPTELNRQGPDEGTQYRSVIFYNNDGQKRIAEAYIAQLDQARIYRHKIVTEIVPFKAFYPAEAYHQNYATLHPDNPYIVYNDAPKVANLRKEFPDVYTGK